MLDSPKDLADVLAEALGRGWKVCYDPTMWRRWRLCRNDYEFCCARRKGDLPRVFVRRVYDEAKRKWSWRSTLFPIPKFMRCGSVEELKLKLETICV